MQDNSFTPTPAPTPSPATSMPEFAATPVAPAPAVPTATSMPTFGLPTPPAQPVAQPTQPAWPATEPVAPATSAPVMSAPVTQPTTQPAPQPESSAQPLTPASIEATYNEIIGAVDDELASPAAPIVSESIPAPELTPAPVAQAAPSLVITNSTPDNTQIIEQETTPIQSATTIPGFVGNGEIKSTVPAHASPNNKKMLIKIAAIAGGVVALIAIIALSVTLISQPKETPAPAQTSAASNAPDNSVPFDELKKDDAINFLKAVGEQTAYFPDDFMDEADLAALKSGGDKVPVLLFSYETKTQAKTLAFNNMVEDFRLKYAEKNLKTTEKVDYSVIYADSETADCEDCQTYLTFSNKVINYFAEPAFDPVTGAFNTNITFVKNTEETAKRYLPILAYVTTNYIVYSSEFKTTDSEYQLVLNIVHFGVDESKVAEASAGEVPHAINLSKNYYTVDRNTGTFSIKLETTAMNQLKPIKSFSLTDEEAQELI